MKVKSEKKEDTCPKCKKSDRVMSMGSGNIKIHGCLRCCNAQGMHTKVSDAKKAWKNYKENYEKTS
jgi:ssDNA-binding Zn-finger/Zn-ribbon topoisomerase 1